MAARKRYELAVPEADYERAKSALELENDPPETLSDAEWARLGELEEPEDLEEETLDQATPPESAEPDGKDSMPDTPERRDAYFRYWYPEDATVEIWSGGGNEDFSGAIEMALKENLIHCRVDGASDDGKVVLVMPEDESRAREIVREIIEGTPLE